MYIYRISSGACIELVLGPLLHLPPPPVRPDSLGPRAFLPWNDHHCHSVPQSAGQQQKLPEKHRRYAPTKGNQECSKDIEHHRTSKNFKQTHSEYFKCPKNPKNACADIIFPPAFIFLCTSLSPLYDVFDHTNQFGPAATSSLIILKSVDNKLMSLGRLHSLVYQKQDECHTLVCWDYRATPPLPKSLIAWATSFTRNITFVDCCISTVILALCKTSTSSLCSSLILWPCFWWNLSGCHLLTFVAKW